MVSWPTTVTFFSGCTFAAGRSIHPVPFIHKDVRDADASDFEGTSAPFFTWRPASVSKPACLARKSATSASTACVRVSTGDLER